MLGGAHPATTATCANPCETRAAALRARETPPLCAWSHLWDTNHPTPRAPHIGQDTRISEAELKSGHKTGFAAKTRSAATNLTQPRSTKSSRVSQ